MINSIGWPIFVTALALLVQPVCGRIQFEAAPGLRSIHLRIGADRTDTSRKCGYGLGSRSCMLERSFDASIRRRSRLDADPPPVLADRARLHGRLCLFEVRAPGSSGSTSCADRSRCRSVGETTGSRRPATGRRATRGCDSPPPRNLPRRPRPARITIDPARYHRRSKARHVARILMRRLRQRRRFRVTPTRPPSMRSPRAASH